MALVLCTGVNQTLLETRRLILEGAGHTVVSVLDEQNLAPTCQQHAFDVAVIGQGVSPNMKRRISLLVREHCGSAKVLELYSPYAGRALDDADSWLEVPVDAPAELVERVNELAEQKGNSAKLS